MEKEEGKAKMEVRKGLKGPQVNFFLTLDSFFLFFNLMIDIGDKKPLFIVFCLLFVVWNCFYLILVRIFYPACFEIACRRPDGKQF